MIKYVNRCAFTCKLTFIPDFIYLSNFVFIQEGQDSKTVGKKEFTMIVILPSLHFGAKAYQFTNVIKSKLSQDPQDHHQKGHWLICLYPCIFIFNFFEK